MNSTRKTYCFSLIAALFLLVLTSCGLNTAPSTEEPRATSKAPQTTTAHTTEEQHTTKAPEGEKGTASPEKEAIILKIDSFGFIQPAFECGKEAVATKVQAIADTDLDTSDIVLLAICIETGEEICLTDDGKGADTLAGDHVFYGSGAFASEEEKTLRWELQTEEDSLRLSTQTTSVLKFYTMQSYYQERQKSDDIKTELDSIAAEFQYDASQPIEIVGESYKKVYEKIAAYLDEQVKKGIVVSYSWNAPDFFIYYPLGGFVYTFGDVDEDVLAGSGPGSSGGGHSSGSGRRNSGILLMLPYGDEMKSSYFVESVNKLAQEFGYFLTVKSGKQVDTELLQSLEGYQIIAINTHGGHSKYSGSYFAIGISNDDISAFDYSNGYLLTSEKGQALVTPAFFEHYYENKHIDNCLFYSGSCCFSDDDRFANSLIRIGANAVLGYTHSVYNSYNQKMFRTFISELMKNDINKPDLTKTARQALDAAKKENGEKDPSLKIVYDLNELIFRDGTKDAWEKRRSELVLFESPVLNEFRLIGEPIAEESPYLLKKDFIREVHADPEKQEFSVLTKDGLHVQRSTADMPEWESVTVSLAEVSLDGGVQVIYFTPKDFKERMGIGGFPSLRFFSNDSCRMIMNEYPAATRSSVGLSPDGSATVYRAYNEDLSPHEAFYLKRGADSELLSPKLKGATFHYAFSQDSQCVIYSAGLGENGYQMVGLFADGRRWEWTDKNCMVIALSDGGEYVYLLDLEGILYVQKRDDTATRIRLGTTLGNYFGSGNTLTSLSKPVFSGGGGLLDVLPFHGPVFNLTADQVVFSETDGGLTYYSENGGERKLLLDRPAVPVMPESIAIMPMTASFFSHASAQGAPSYSFGLHRLNQMVYQTRETPDYSCDLYWVDENWEAKLLTSGAESRSLHISEDGKLLHYVRDGKLYCMELTRDVFKEKLLAENLSREELGSYFYASYNGENAFWLDVYGKGYTVDKEGRLEPVLSDNPISFNDIQPAGDAGFIYLSGGKAYYTESGTGELMSSSPFMSIKDREGVYVELSGEDGVATYLYISTDGKTLQQIDIQQKLKEPKEDAKAFFEDVLSLTSIPVTVLINKDTENTLYNFYRRLAISDLNRALHQKDPEKYPHQSIWASGDYYQLSTEDRARAAQNPSVLQWIDEWVTSCSLSDVTAILELLFGKDGISMEEYLGKDTFVTSDGYLLTPSYGTDNIPVGFIRYRVFDVQSVGEGNLQATVGIIQVDIGYKMVDEWPEPALGTYQIYDLISRKLLASGEDPFLEEYDNYKVFAREYPIEEFQIETITITLFRDDTGIHLR